MGGILVKLDLLSSLRGIPWVPHRQELVASFLALLLIILPETLLLRTSSCGTYSAGLGNVNSFVYPGKKTQDYQ